MDIKSRGSALISALLIMALITILVTAMVGRVRMDLAQTQRGLEYEQMRLSAPAVTFWAMKVLQDQNHIWISQLPDGRIASFPKKLQKPQRGVTLTGEIYDLQANFNLNNLLDNTYQALFYELINNVIGDQTHAASILLATSEWIRPGLKHVSAETIIHGPMQDVSEFRLVPGVDATDYNALIPWITVLPAITPINLNTAQLPVLRALAGGLSLKEAKEIQAVRGTTGIKNIMMINELLSRLHIPAEKVDIKSNFFLVVGHSSGATLVRTTHTILQRYTNPVGQSVVRQLMVADV